MNPVSGKIIPAGKDVLNLAKVRPGLRGLGKQYEIAELDPMIPAGRGLDIATAIASVAAGPGALAFLVASHKKKQKKKELLEWGRARKQRRKRRREGPPAEELAEVRVRIEKMKKDVAALRAGALP